MPYTYNHYPRANFTGAAQVKCTVRDLDLTKLPISDEQFAVRTEGVHVSHIIRYIKANIGEGAEEWPEDDFATVGRCWERYLAETLYPEPRYARLGELERDGIIGSPDCLDLELSRFGEFKVSWTSPARYGDSMKFREHRWQLMSYIALGIPLLGAQTHYDAWIDVYHLCCRPPEGKGKHYELQFSHGEIREHWQMMKVNAEFVRSTVKER